VFRLENRRQEGWGEARQREVDRENSGGAAPDKRGDRYREKEGWRLLLGCIPKKPRERNSETAEIPSSQRERLSSSGGVKGLTGLAGKAERGKAHKER